MTSPLETRPGSGFTRIHGILSRMGAALDPARGVRWPAHRVPWPAHGIRWPARRIAWLAAAVVGGLVLLPLWLGYLAETPPSHPGTMPVPLPPIGTAGPEVRQPAEQLRGAIAPEAMLAGRRDQAAWQPASAPPVPGDPGAWGRRIMRQASVSVELDDVDQAIARLTELVEGAGGYVADTQVYGNGNGGAGRATITAYVPSAAFARTLQDLERLGRTTARRITGQDVSEEFVDLEARVRNLERHEAQLLGFMGRAQKVADLLSLENELARVRGEIERLTGRLRFLRARTEMAGIQASLVRVGPAAPVDSLLARAWARVNRAFVAGWRAAFDVAVALAALAAQLSPLAVPAAFGWGLYRRFRRPPVAPPPAAAA
jgi:hypothetical protein